MDFLTQDSSRCPCTVSPTVYASVSAALRTTEYSRLEKMVVDKLNQAAIDFTSVVGPAKRLVPASTMAEGVDPAAALSLRPSKLTCQ